MPNKNAAIFVSHGSDANVYIEALRRVRCYDFIRVDSPDDISTHAPCDIAIVEIFDHRRASDQIRHFVDDASPGVQMLKRIRTQWPNCVVLAISHTTCESGSSYVEGLLLADWAIAVNWILKPNDRSLNPQILVANALNRAMEAHLRSRSFRFQVRVPCRMHKPSSLRRRRFFCV